MDEADCRCLLWDLTGASDEVWEQANCTECWSALGCRCEPCTTGRKGCPRCHDNSR